MAQNSIPPSERLERLLTHEDVAAMLSPVVDRFVALAGDFVQRPDVQKRFPIARQHLAQFSSNGGFSAGVFKEKGDQKSRLRLYLKDGMALTQWIHQYAAQRLLDTQKMPNQTLDRSRPSREN